MTKTLRLTLLAMVGLALNATKLQAADDDGFVSIFDGKTLKGWEAMPAETAPAWTVKDGVIHGDGDKGVGYLAFENKDLADLELKLEYRFPDGKKANSGISIRAIKDKTKRRHFQCYHADLGSVGIGKHILGAWDFHTPGRKEHRCFRGDRLVIDENDKPTITAIENSLTQADIKKGEWNTVHVIARGSNFKFFINGELASEFTERLPAARRLKRGMIQLQIHDPGMTVEFKDIRLKVLDGRPVEGAGRQ